MEVKVLESEGDEFRFILTGVSPAFANGLRRVIMAEVPVMAVDDVMFFENSSIMYDEILAHRLGLVPLTTDLESYLLPEECTCKSELGCSKCRTSLTLEVEAKETMTVYSGDLKPEDEDVRPAADRIPLVKLAPGQRIKTEAYARLGKGKVHSKWQSVSACSYRFEPESERYVFQIEPTGALPPQKILSEASKIIMKKALSFEDELSKSLKG